MPRRRALTEPPTRRGAPARCTAPPSRYPAGMRARVCASVRERWFLAACEWAHGGFKVRRHPRTDACVRTTPLSRMPATTSFAPGSLPAWLDTKLASTELGTGLTNFEAVCMYRPLQACTCTLHPTLTTSAPAEGLPSTWTLSVLGPTAYQVPAPCGQHHLYVCTTPAQATAWRTSTLQKVAFAAAPPRKSESRAKIERQLQL